MVEAVVEFDYVAQEADELNLRKGDVITNIKTQPGGWWEGTLSGKRGMFPDNFVKVLSETDDVKDINSVTVRSSSGRRCKVLFSYAPANNDELKLEVDDVIDILTEVEEGWWKGRLGDKIGVFPSNFVEEIVATRTAGTRKPRTISREETMKEMCRVLFPYEAANEDELTLKEGELITLLSREVADQGWWRGELRGKVGVFPDNFVEVVQLDEQQHTKPDRPPVKSQLVTTNRTRDSITKPAVAIPAAGTTKGKAVSQHRLSDRVLKADERSSSAGSAIRSLLGKKSSLPPPTVKKPQQVGSSNLISTPMTKHNATVEQWLMRDAVDGAGPSRPVHKTSPQGLIEFDSVERSEMLKHPTANRVKAPRRRLPSVLHNKDADSQNSGLMNGSAEVGHTVLDNHIAEDEGEEEGVERSKGRAWERGKAPWVEELKLNQAKKTSGLNSTSSVLGQSPPEQAERKQLKSKLDPSPEPKQAQASVTMRMHPARPQSMFQDSSSRVTPQTRPLSSSSPPDPACLLAELSQSHSKPLSGSATSPLVHTLQTRQEPASPQARPASTSPVLATLMAKQAADSTSPSSLSDPDLLASPSANSPGLASESSVTYKQFVELKDRVSKLEEALEAQQEMFTKMLKDLSIKLSEETDRRLHLQQEMDKVTSLVTHV